MISMNSINKVIATLFLLLSAGGGVLSRDAVVMAQGSESSLPLRTVSVVGQGTASAEPDQASLTAGITTQAKTAREALDANSAHVQKIMDALLDDDGVNSLGITKKDLQTSGFSVYPRYDYPRDADPVFEGYQVSNTLKVKVRKVENLGLVLDEVVTVGTSSLDGASTEETGSNNQVIVSGVSFQVKNAKTMRDKARVKAVQDAQNKAELYVTNAAAGLALGKIVSMSETSFSTPSSSNGYNNEAAFDAPSRVPIAVGENQVSATLYVVYELMDDPATV